MGRPKLPENEKLRSFAVRLAPRLVGRQLTLMSRILGRPQQEILRDAVESAVSKAYADMIRDGAPLPPGLSVAAMTEEQFQAILERSPEKARRGPRLVRRESAHA